MTDHKDLQRFFEKKCAPEEAQKILQWLKTHAGSKYLQRMMEDDWKSGSGESIDMDFERNLHEIYARIRMQQLKHESRATTFRRAMKTAAVLVLLFSSVFLIVRTAETTRKPVAPIVEYKIIQKATDKGEKLSSSLSDGTTVMLNAQSRLVERFSDTARLVELEGEAYFSVKKNAARPFLVVAGPVTVKVTGTSFNVAARDPGSIVVSLVEGKVEAVAGQDDHNQSVSINPGEEVVYTAENHSFTRQSYDYASRIGWKDGILLFTQTDIHEMTRRLESWYGVEITLRNQPPASWRFTGSFRNESLENVLAGMQYMKNIEYEIKGNQLYLKFH